jgi:Ca2+-binding RTX toxin-like protein
MRIAIRVLMTATALVTLYGGVLADTCTVAGVTRTCDFVCGFPSNPPNPACVAINNDVNGDGVRTTCGSTLGGNTINGGGADEMICGRDGDDTITGSGGNDQINGAGGNDGIDGGTGNDTIEGGGGKDSIEGGSGDDILSGNTGQDFTDDGGNFIDGGNNNDSILGTGGDDELLGGSGDDSILGQGGRDVIMGEGGADFLVSQYGGPNVNEVFGDLLCGGPGDDTIFAWGPGHQCVDAGTQQVVTGTENDCNYANNQPADSDDHDIGTQRNCANPIGFDANRHPSCGCD